MYTAAYGMAAPPATTGRVHPRPAPPASAASAGML